MKEHFQDTGTRKWAGNDLIELQSEPLAAIQAVVEPYANCIIQGCTVEKAEGDKYKLNGGFAALRGREADKESVKVVRVSEEIAETDTFYLSLACRTDERVYATNESKPVSFDYYARITTTPPMDENEEVLADELYLKIDHTNTAPRLPESLTVNFAAAKERDNIKTGEPLGTIAGKIKKWLGDLKDHAFRAVGKSDLDEGLQTEINGKIDKDGNKVLSANDFTNDYKTKLDGIADGANKTIVDLELKSDSPNPVQNKAVKAALDGKVDNSDAGLSGAINKLTTGTDAPVDDDYYVAQYANGGTSTTTYHRRKHSQLWGYIKGKVSSMFLPLSGGTMTGPITYNTASGTSKTSNYISAGGGYGTGSGKYGLKLLAVDQSDCQGGIGADLTGGSYELTVATGKNPNNANTERITFAKHSVNSKTYTKLAEIDGSGNFNAIGQVKENGTRVYSPDNKPTYSDVGAAASSHSHGTASTTAAGFMSAADKTKLNGIATGANKISVDATLSTTSTNPVQNKVVKAELDTKLPLAGGTITGNLRLKGSGNYGNKLNFGDGDYAYISEPSDDVLEIKGDKGINLLTSAGMSTLKVNGKQLPYIYYMANVQCPDSAIAKDVYNPAGVSAEFSITKNSLGWNMCSVAVPAPAGYTHVKPLILGQSSGAAWIDGNSGRGTFNVYIVNSGNSNNIIGATFTLVLIAHN